MHSSRPAAPGPHAAPGRQDVEKIAAKKGVVLQTIKEVLQSLVDDDLVHSERIGASNYFWCAVVPRFRRV